MSDKKILIDIILTLIIIVIFLQTVSWFFQASLFVSTMYILTFLLIVSSIWFYCRKGYLRFIISLFLVVFLFYLLTFSWEFFPEWININLDNYIYHAGLLDFFNFHTSIIYEKDYTLVNQQVFFTASKLKNDTLSYLTLSLPEKTIWYNISLYETVSKYTDNEWKNFRTPLINKANSTSLENITYFPIFIEKSGTYYLETEYFMPKLHPYGLVGVRIRGHPDVPENPKTTISVSVDFNDLSYECVNPCVVPTSKDITVTPVSRLKYVYVRPSGQERPFVHLSAVGNNVDDVSFTIRTVNKYALILRQVALGLIAGLTISVVTLMYQKRDEYGKRFKKVERLLRLQIIKFIR